MYIVACGPFAAGKTSVTKLLSSEFGWQIICEDLRSNPYFAGYYAEPPKWAFHVAVAFLVRAMESQRAVALQLSRASVCQDWFVLEHHSVYNVLMHHTGLLSSDEFDTCARLHSELLSRAVIPDLVLYVTAAPDVLLDRVSNRRRQEEASVTLEYIAELVSLYESWVQTLDYPTLRIDTENFDFVADPVAQQTVLAAVRRWATNNFDQHGRQSLQLPI